MTTTAGQPTTSTLVRFSTANIPTTHRMEHWEAHNAKALIGLDIRAFESAPLAATEINLYFPSVRFARVDGSAQLVERSARMIREHPTGDVAVFFALRGDAFFYHEKGLLPLRPGQAVLYDADRPFVRGFAHGLRELVLTIPREEFMRLSQGKPLNEPMVFEFATPTGAPGTDPAARNIAGLIDSAILHPTEDLVRVEQQIMNLVEQLVARAVGTDQRSARRRALEAISREFGDPALNRARVAAVAGMSERQLTRIFGEQGTTFADQLMSHRLEAAESLMMSQSDLAISAVSRRCGFTSPSHFSRAFKRHVGVSPSEFQKSAHL